VPIAVIVHGMLFLYTSKLLFEGRHSDAEGKSHGGDGYGPEEVNEPSAAVMAMEILLGLRGTNPNCADSPTSGFGQPGNGGEIGLRLLSCESAEEGRVWSSNDEVSADAV
jgi:hypothetical protein